MINQPAAMVLIDQMWDEVVAGPQPQRGLGKLRKVDTVTNKGEGSSKFHKSLSMPATPTTPGTPTTPSPTAARKDNVWRSVFNPGSNLATKGIGSNYFDSPKSVGSPTVYDWLYSGETRSKHR
ncbi:auxin-repressed 12.5 kDa protein-like [Cynara cardunculus var. scolymus]|uniref:auxin-repressed 12.5 kDa protein-like n=1 Tax=Cynara cardunculus var. scolymus TaxID=59895 RepID=UPI000D6242B3|nr:auxin-repressed 12.5 kDa protein-like [Cynara cardunculus var. scolymus]